MQTATLPAATSHSNASRTYQEKPLYAALSVVGLNEERKELTEIIVVRWYMSASKSASNVYCNVWIRGYLWVSGKGNAGGGGYHKQSAALGEALDSAGVKLAEDIAGCGDSACDNALEAIAREMGYTNTLIVKHS